MAVETEVDLLPRAVPGQIPNGIFTVINEKTNAHKTIKVVTVDSGPLTGRRIVYVFTGTDNTSMWDYTGVAFLNTEQEEFEEEYIETTVDEFGAVTHETLKRTSTRPKDVLQVWRRQRGSELHKIVANGWFRVVTTGVPGYRYELAKHCVRCNRVLTNPASIAAGVGPVCQTGGIDTDV